MTRERKLGLLTSRDAPPVAVFNGDGRSLFLLVGDHAGNTVPECLADLGLPKSELTRHIALDIGVYDLGQELSRALDAPFIAQPYSRLVIDCNRDPHHPDAVAAYSDGTVIPGNAGLTADERRQRVDAIHRPYHGTIADVLAARDRARLPTIVVALHSFTPVLAGHVRPWRMGVLYGGRNEAFAREVLTCLRKIDPGIGDNQPYRFDGTDFTVPAHAFGANRPYVELEIRQDLLGDAGSIVDMAGVLSQALTDAGAQIAGAR